MGQETKEDNDKKSDEILEEVRYLVENGRYSETLILLSQVIPKIADDDKRSQALDFYNSAKLEIKRKYEAHQDEGIRTLKHGIRLIRSNNFKEAKDDRFNFNYQTTLDFEYGCIGSCEPFS